MVATGVSPKPPMQWITGKLSKEEKQSLALATEELKDMRTPEDRANFDIVIGGGGGMTTAPEWRIWTEISQTFDLRFLQLPDECWRNWRRKANRSAASSPPDCIAESTGQSRR